VHESVATPAQHTEYQKWVAHTRTHTLTRTHTRTHTHEPPAPRSSCRRRSGRLCRSHCQQRCCWWGWWWLLLLGGQSPQSRGQAWVLHQVLGQTGARPPDAITHTCLHVLVCGVCVCVCVWVGGCVGSCVCVCVCVCEVCMNV